MTKQQQSKYGSKSFSPTRLFHQLSLTHGSGTFHPISLPLPSCLLLGLLSVRTEERETEGKWQSLSLTWLLRHPCLCHDRRLKPGSCVGCQCVDSLKIPKGPWKFRASGGRGYITRHWLQHHIPPPFYVDVFSFGGFH